MSSAAAEIIAISLVRQFLSAVRGAESQPHVSFQITPEDFASSLLDCERFQLQTLPAEQTSLYVCGLQKCATIKEPCAVIAAPGNTHPDTLRSSPFQRPESPGTLQRGKESAGGLQLVLYISNAW